MSGNRVTQRRYRVLVLADSCNPDWPSLPVVGYKFVRALAEHADVTLITQIRNRPNIDRDGIGKATVRYVDSERVAAPLHRFASLIRGHQDKGWTIQMAMDYPAYLYFEHLAFAAERRAIRDGAYDLIHRVTPMTPAIPSPIARKSPIPFVLGPLNGNLPWPPFYAAERRREREWLSKFRSAYKLLPYRLSTLQRSSAILAAFEHTVSDIAPQFREKVINFPEVGIDPDLFRLSVRPPSERVTVLFAGRLVPYKLPEAVVRAFAASPILRKHRLVIVGDGPERQKLESLSAQHGLESCVEILGRRTQLEVSELMQRSHVFAFPSIRELGAGVVVEAMACGMACVAVDYGGPATLLADDRGLLVPVGPLDSIVENFKNALESLVSDQSKISELGARAHRHAIEFYSWDRKAQKTIEIYDWATKKRPDIPRFW
jgi:glycosyltransferase involved in cell wall biosynthesis